MYEANESNINSTKSKEKRTTRFSFDITKATDLKFQKKLSYNVPQVLSRTNSIYKNKHKRFNSIESTIPPNSQYNLLHPLNPLNAFTLSPNKRPSSYTTVLKQSSPFSPSNPNNPLTQRIIINNQYKTNMSQKSIKDQLNQLNRRSSQNAVETPTIKSPKDLKHFLHSDQKMKRIQVRLIADYLSSTSSYFKKIKHKDKGERLLNRVVKVLKYERFDKGKYIVHSGDEADKIYILLEGKVGLYAQEYFKRKYKVKEYLNLLRVLLCTNSNRYYRTLSKNKSLNLNIKHLFELNSNDERLNEEYNFIVEEDVFVNYLEKGASFGEMALIKKEKMDKSVKAETKCILVYIERDNYNKLMRDEEIRKLENTFVMFVKDYPVFLYMNNQQLVKLFNGFSRMKLNKGEFIYKQDEPSEAIYIIENGNFEEFTYFSFKYLNDYVEYINNEHNNLINVSRDCDLSEFELKILYEQLKEKAISSPFNYDDKIKVKNFSNAQEKESIGKLKLEENDMYNSFFKVKIRSINFKEVIGLVDGLELKHRYTSIQCKSEVGNIIKVSLFTLFILLNYRNQEYNLRNFLTQFLKDKKNILIDKLNTYANTQSKILQDMLNSKYTSLAMNKNNSTMDQIITMKMMPKDPFDVGNKYSFTKLSDLPKKFISRHPKEDNKINCNNENNEDNVVHLEPLLNYAREQIGKINKKLNKQIELLPREYKAGIKTIDDIKDVNGIKNKSFRNELNKVRKLSTILANKENKNNQIKNNIKGLNKHNNKSTSNIASHSNKYSGCRNATSIQTGYTWRTNTKMNDNKNNNVCKSISNFSLNGYTKINIDKNDVRGIIKNKILQTKINEDVNQDDIDNEFDLIKNIKYNEKEESKGIKNKFVFKIERFSRNLLNGYTKLAKSSLHTSIFNSTSHTNSILMKSMMGFKRKSSYNKRPNFNEKDYPLIMEKGYWKSNDLYGGNGDDIFQKDVYQIENIRNRNNNGNLKRSNSCYLDNKI